MRTKNPVKPRQRCKFIDDEAGEEDDRGNVVADADGDSHDADKPTADDIAFIDDSSNTTETSEEIPVRISRREKRLNSDDIALIQENVGIRPAASSKSDLGRRKRISKNTSVYKDSDETDIHSSDEGFVVSDSEGEEEEEEESVADSERSGSVDDASDGRPSCPGSNITERLERIKEDVRHIEDFIKQDKFWAPDKEDNDEEEDPDASETEEEVIPRHVNPLSIMAPMYPLTLKKKTPAMFEPGFKTKVSAPTKPMQTKKAPPKKKPRQIVPYVSADGHVNPYFVDRVTGKVSFRKPDGTVCISNGADLVEDNC